MKYNKLVEKICEDIEFRDRFLSSVSNKLHSLSIKFKDLNCHCIQIDGYYEVSILVAINSGFGFRYDTIISFDRLFDFNTNKISEDYECNCSDFLNPVINSILREMRIDEIFED